MAVSRPAPESGVRPLQTRFTTQNQNVTGRKASLMHLSPRPTKVAKCRQGLIRADVVGSPAEFEAPQADAHSSSPRVDCWVMRFRSPALACMRKMALDERTANK